MFLLILWSCLREKAMVYCLREKAMATPKVQAIFIALFVFFSLCFLVIVESHQQIQPPQQAAKKWRSAARAKEWLISHNKVRQTMGEPPLVWDKNLARYARRFAAKRKADCQMIHSGGPHGENIFWAARNTFSPSQVVSLWVDEQRNYNTSANTCVINKLCGHYKQVVWRDSLRLGCSLVDCLNGGAYGICSYSPPGNYQGENPFERHE